jgi:hypothetical protein
MLTVADVLYCPPGRRLVAVFPTLHRYDLLEQSIRACLSSADRPDHIAVIDNGAGWASPFGSAVEVLPQALNRGCAGSWKFALETFAGDDVLLLGDDIAIGSQTIAAFRRTPGWCVTAFGFGAILIRPQLIAHVGMPDDTLWPAYCDDVDWKIRMRLAVESAGIILSDQASSPGDQYSAILPTGMRYVTGEGIEVQHLAGGSASLQDWMHPWIARTRERMRRKWGWSEPMPHDTPAAGVTEPYGGLGEDPQTVYFDECRSHVEYAQVMGNLGRALECGDASPLSLAAKPPSLPRYVPASASPLTAVQIGTDVGRWALALSHAGIRNLTVFDPTPNPEFAYLGRLAEHSGWSLDFRRRPVSVADPDLLLILSDAPPDLQSWARAEIAPRAKLTAAIAVDAQGVPRLTIA